MPIRRRYRPGKKYDTRLWKLRDDRSGFPILSKDIMRDGNKPELVVSKDTWEPFLNVRLPVPTIYTSIPDPSRPITDPSLGDIEFCYVITAANGSVIGVSCSSNEFWNRTRATTTQIALYRPVIDDQTLTYSNSSVVGAQLGTVIATDPNNRTLEYSILSGNEFGFFNIDQNNGLLTLASLAGFDFDGAYDLTVQVKQTTGVSRLTDTGIVSVVNVNTVSFDGLMESLNSKVWLKFNEASGATIADYSGNGNNATLTLLGRTWLYDHTQLFPNLPGKSIFENTGGWRCNITSSLSLYDFTTKLSGVIAAKYVAATAGADRVLMARWTTNKNFMFYYANPTTLGLRLAASGAPTAIAATITGSIGNTGVAKWVGFTYDGASQTVVLYLNGLPITSSVSGNVPATLNTANLSGVVLGIGCDSSFSNPFFGDLQDMALFPEVLTPSQMADLYSRII